MQALVALWGLGMLVRVRHNYFPEYRLSWRAMIAGLAGVILGTLGISGLIYWGANSLGIIVCVTSYVSGIFLFLAGLGRWLVPVLESARQNKLSLTKLSFLTKLENALSVPLELKDKLRQALEDLCHNFNCRAGAVYTRETLSREMLLTASLNAEEKDLPLTLDKQTWLRICQCPSTKTAGMFGLLLLNQKELAGSFPIVLRVGSRVLGLAFLWPSGGPEESLLPDQSLLQVWGNCLGRAIQDYHHLQLKSLRQKSVSGLSRVSNLLNPSESLEGVFPKLAGVIRNLVDYHILCLAVLDQSGKNMERYTVGTAGNLLLEKGVNRSTHGTLVDKVLKTGRVIINGQLKSNDSCVQEMPMLSTCKSIMALPVGADNRLRGVIIMGHRDQHIYRPPQARTLKLVLYHLTSYLLLRQYQAGLAQRDRLFDLLQQLSAELTELPGPETRLKNVPELISTSLPVTFCRVSVVGEDQQTLRTLTEFSLRRECTPRASTTFSLGDLPWHRLALGSGKPMLVNQDDPESMMPESELEAAFGRPMNSALLVPVKLGGNSLGLLTMAEERSWARRPFTHPEIQTIELLAEQLANSIRRPSLEREPAPSPEPDWNISLGQLRRSLSDPICGIMGAAELLLAKREAMEPELRHYARIIQRMTQRIIDTVKQEELSTC